MPRSPYPPLKVLSQNFLRNENQARELAGRIPLEPQDVVVELGAGEGALTFFLAERVSRLLAVEIDKGLARELAERVKREGRNNIEVLHQDLMKADWPAWKEDLGKPYVLVGNLPYHISTPILFKIIENRLHIRAAYIMLQKEVADRLLARPGTKAYGVITVLIGYYAEVRPLMQLRPSAFFPKPKVSSTFVELRFRQAMEPPLADEELFRWVARRAFAQRRKQLKNALIGDGRFSAEIVVKALEEEGIDPQGRGETLNVYQLAGLANTLVRLCG
jgi:16S rRNA (adenine1518-N6/adenine1519-N6)-dimethyltransferase